MAEKMYLVTGAAGFLGGTIVRQLIARGDKVRAFVLPNDKAIQYVPKEAEIVEGDLCNIEDLQRFFDVPQGLETIVLHIASIVTVNPEYNQKVMDVNVGGTRNVIQVMKEHPECKRLVYCSSTGAIPEKPKGWQIEEVNCFDAERVEGCYSQSKALATQVVLDAVAQDGINACIVHPSGILGPEDFAVGETTGTLIKIINGEMPAGIAGSFNLCDVRDLAAGTIAAADKGRCGECYILGNKVPIKLAYFMADIMEKKAARKGKKPMMTRFSVYNLARNNDFNSGKAKQELNYHTRSYRETIHDEVQWLKATGKIA